MLIKEMTVKECQEVLTRISIGRLGCAHNNRPYVVPIYFAYEPDHLYGFTTLGRKIEWMRLNPRVSLEVHEVKSHNSWTSVILNGRYEELPDTPDFQFERFQAQKLLEKRFLWWQTAYAAALFRRENDPAPAIFYCIHVDDMTGRKAVPDSLEVHYSEDIE